MNYEVAFVKQVNAFTTYTYLKVTKQNLSIHH